MPQHKTRRHLVPRRVHAALQSQASHLPQSRLLASLPVFPPPHTTAVLHLNLAEYDPVNRPGLLVQTLRLFDRRPRTLRCCSDNLWYPRRSLFLLPATRCRTLSNWPPLDLCCSAISPSFHPSLPPPRQKRPARRQRTRPNTTSTSTPPTLCRTQTRAA